MKIINNIANTANIVNISKEDYDYLLMFLHLTNIMKDYIINNLHFCTFKMPNFNK